MKKFFVVLAAVLTIMSACTRIQKNNILNQRKPAIANQNLIINISDLTENALFFPVEIDGMQMEVMAVKTPDGIIRTAFNACNVCYKSGKGYYVQADTKLICQECKKRFSLDMIGTETGGCSPAPIFPEHKTVTDSSITVSREYLAEAKAMFESWKE